MARTGDIRCVSNVGGDLQATGIRNQRLACVAIDGDNVGTLRRVTNETDTVLVRSVLMERTGQHDDQQRSEAHEGRQFRYQKASPAAQHHCLELSQTQTGENEAVSQIWRSNLDLQIKQLLTKLFAAF